MPSLGATIHVSTFKSQGMLPRRYCEADALDRALAALLQTLFAILKTFRSSTKFYRIDPLDKTNDLITYVPN